MILLDVGVWLAAVWGRHARHSDARAWIEDQDRELALCRVTEMSLLRLLSNPTILAGDALTRAGCWTVLDRLRADERIVHAEEPGECELMWRSLSARDDRSHKLWTDDYLAAFARSGGIPIATLDPAFADRYPSVDVETLRRPG